MMRDPLLKALAGVLVIALAVWAAQRLFGADLDDFMADGKPHGQAIQEALDSLVDSDGRWPNTSGGTLHISRGVYNVYEPITIPCGGITVQGVGGLATLNCLINWRGEGAMFTLASPSHKDRRSGVRFADIAMKGRNGNTLFRFADNKTYVRPFIFDRVTANYFGTVFAFERDKVSVWGGLQCTACVFNYNGQVVRATSTPLGSTGGTVNEVEFRSCQLHKNCVGTDEYAFDFSWTSKVSFDGCILENQPRVLRVSHTLGVRVVNCRFERNIRPGIAAPLVIVDKCRKVRFESNVHRIVPDEESKDAPVTVLIRDCDDITVPTGLRKVVIERTKWRPL